MNGSAPRHRRAGAAVAAALAAVLFAASRRPRTARPLVIDLRLSVQRTVPASPSPTDPPADQRASDHPAAGRPPSARRHPAGTRRPGTTRLQIVRPPADPGSAP